MSLRSLAGPQLSLLSLRRCVPTTLLASSPHPRQVLIAGAVKGGDDQLAAALPRLINTRSPDQSLLRLTWEHDAAWLKGYASSVLGDAGGGLVCFPSLLAGTGGLSRQMAPVGGLPYRQAVAQRLGLVEPPQRRPVITILNKAGGRRVVENTGAVAALLRRRYPAARVQVVDFGARPDMTMPDQVGWASRSAARSSAAHARA